MSLGLQYAPWEQLPWTDGETKPWDTFSKSIQTTPPSEERSSKSTIQMQPGTVPATVPGTGQPTIVQPAKAHVAENNATYESQMSKPLLKIHEGLGRQHRAFPKAQVMQLPQPLEHIPKCAPSNYSAMEIHGFYGLIDDGSDAYGRVLIVHVPKWVRGYVIDIRQGDRLPVNRVDGNGGGTLTVLSTGRHKYYSPGKRVTTCTVCVPEEQWALFVD